MDDPAGAMTLVAVTVLVALVSEIFIDPYSTPPRPSE